MTAQQYIHLSGTPAHHQGCPFYNQEQVNCRAALLSFAPDLQHRFRYCLGDDHDDCTVFLAKALRSSATGGLDRDVAAHCRK